MYYLCYERSNVNIFSLFHSLQNWPECKLRWWLGPGRVTERRIVGKISVHMRNKNSKGSRVEPGEKLWRWLAGPAAWGQYHLEPDGMWIQILGPIPVSMWGHSSLAQDYSLFTESWGNIHLGPEFPRSRFQRSLWLIPSQLLSNVLLFINIVCVGIFISLI